MISSSSFTMEDDVRTLWKIPNIVHFCSLIKPICADISLINITDFEHAVENNSYVLTDMAIRFTKICGFFDRKTNKWWDYMKRFIQKKHIKYDFGYTLDLVTYFDDLTPKQKVDTLYILSQLILDVERINRKLIGGTQNWSINVKPLGYDLYKSAYWYFGTTRLYREDFEQAYDASTNSVQTSKSIVPVLKMNPSIEPYPSGIFGSGKWNVICDDDIDSWHSFASTTKYSKNVNIISLHEKILDIIEKLPTIKKAKAHYVYIKPLPSQPFTSSRSLRSRNVDNDKNVNVTQTKYDDSINSQFDKAKINENACDSFNLPNIDMNENCSTNKNFARTLRTRNVGSDKNHMTSTNLYSSNNKECLKNVNVTQTKKHDSMNSQFDKTKINENTCNSFSLPNIDMNENCSTNKNFARTLRTRNVGSDKNDTTSTNLYSSNNKECLKNVNVIQTKYDYSMNPQLDKTKINDNACDLFNLISIDENENDQIKKLKNETVTKLPFKSVSKNKMHNINSFDVSKMKQECLKNVVQVNLTRCDQEYPQHFKNLGQKSQTLKRFKGGTKLINSCLDKIKINENEQIKKLKNETVTKLPFKSVSKNKMHNINSFDVSKMKQECLKNVVQVNLTRCDQEYPQHFKNLGQKSQTLKRFKGGTKLINSCLDKIKINENELIKKFKNETAMNLPLKSIKKNKIRISNIKNVDVSKLKQECLKNVVRINLIRCDQEYPLNFKSSGQKLRTSQRFKSKTKLMNSRTDKVKINENKQIKKLKNKTAMKLPLKSVNKNKIRISNIKSVDESKTKQDCSEHNVRISLKRFDRENTQNFENLEQKYHVSKRLKSETNLRAFKNLNF